MRTPAAINIELTSRCNKECFMCGRRKLEKDHAELCNWGDMDFELVRYIADQVTGPTVVQLHNNGEPLLYLDLEAAIYEFRHCITGLNTNAKLLALKAWDVRKLNSLTISIIPDDPEGDDQLLMVQDYLKRVEQKPPIIVFRMLGRIDNDRLTAYLMLAAEHNIKTAYRQLHAPGGSFEYEQGTTMPEMGICQEALFKLSIDRHGNVSPCVRFDPKGEHILGNLRDRTISGLFNGTERTNFLKHHLAGRRDLASPVCKVCDYWGIPKGGERWSAEDMIKRG